ncbi:MAG: NADPH-dependent glutamate synthase [Nitrospirae bacterium]|jgi:glutamate synthase (NADPH) small chain|nr:NADPH-dependent glutamate synthase [Nitrospirota bacterium]
MEDKKKKNRIKMREQTPQARIQNFMEVPYGYTPNEAVEEASRCLSCLRPACRNGCPVEVDIPSFIKLIKEGKFIEAAWKVKEKNALPAVCGRVCPQEIQCESLCILGKKGEPVAIGNLERFVADYEASEGEIQTPEKPKVTGRKVAIIGSGPGGLTCAADLIKSGHQVTLFEALHKPGGVLVYGIPEFRLPKTIVEREVEYIKKLGVEVVVNAVIGKLYTIDELLNGHGYDACFIATGAGLPMFLGIPGENLNGVYSANEFLTRANLMKAYLFPEYDTPVKRGKKVAVFGGGNVTIDTARVALRLGAEKVYLIYRRSEEEMPARKAEIHHAHEEGIEFMLLTNPTGFIDDGKGNICAVECSKMELGEPDESGRRRPVPIKGSKFQVEIDVGIPAIGTRSNPLLLHTVPDLKLNKKGYISAEADTGMTSKQGVFAGGDIVTGSATVILAMGAGKKAAKSINEYLKWKYWDFKR